MRHFLLLSSLALWALNLGGVAAQEPVPGEPAPPAKVFAIQAFADRESGGVVYSTFGDVTSMPLAMPIAGGLIGGMVPGDDINMLAMEQFQQELELIEDQKEKLAELRKQLQQKRTALYGDVRSMDPKKLGPYLREAEGLLQDEGKEKLSEILLPHQVDRLKQLRLQMQMRNRGLNALAGAELADTLKLTDEQKELLAEKQKEAEKQLREKIEEIRRQLQREIMQEVLTAEQRHNLAKLMGDEFRYKPTDPQFPRPPVAEVKKVAK